MIKSTKKYMYKINRKIIDPHIFNEPWMNLITDESEWKNVG